MAKSFVAPWVAGLSGSLVFSGSVLADPALLPAVRVASGFTTPVFATAPQGDSRLFIVEKGGAIKVRDSSGNILGTDFLNISSKVATSGEQGLLGLAFDPGYASNGVFYVNYVSAAGNTVVERYTATNPAGNVANAASATPVISFAQPGATNHKAGWIGFRPGEANNLYIATGDGGSSSATAQNTTSLLGKILRINVNADDYPSDPNSNFSTPADNPFAGNVAYRGEIWDLGLRNPYRNSFDRTTGAFYIADVGDGKREEINRELTAADGGKNYGWDIREGRGPRGSDTLNSPPVGLTDPVYDYDRTTGFGQSIIGGYVYRGSAFPELNGYYIFGDYISGKVFMVPPGGLPAATNTNFDVTALIKPVGSTLNNITSFGEDGFGELYILDQDGEVFKFQAVPEPGTVATGLFATAALLLCRRGGKFRN